MRPTSDIALRRAIRVEAASRAHVDAVFALSPNDADLERNIGSPRVEWLPRTISSTALDWRPAGRRLGYVGTIDHAPNLEGLVSILRAMEALSADAPRIRVVGGPARIGAWLADRYRSVDYLGPLDNADLVREAATWTGFIHPIFCESRGCSTKLATAIGWLLPVVTTSHGRRGYEWREGSLLECDDPETFARQALALFDPGAAAEARAEVARAAASSPSMSDVAAKVRRVLDLPAAARYSRMTRTVIILSPHFPPSTLAGVHRARHLAKHLPSHGWRPIVVRAHERHYTEAIDPALAALVPAEVEQVRTGALPAGLCSLAWPSAISACAPCRTSREPSAAWSPLTAAHVVFITGSPFYPMLLTRQINTLLRSLPVVLDFQDPWVSTHGATHPWGTKAWLSHRAAVALEPAVVRDAAFVTSVSDIQNEQMAARYRWFDPSRMAAIPIGGDPDDFAALRSRPPANTRVKLEAGMTNLTYVGTFLPRAGPLIERLFAALAPVMCVVHRQLWRPACA